MRERREYVGIRGKIWIRPVMAGDEEKGGRYQSVLAWRTVLEIVEAWGQNLAGSFRNKVLAHGFEKRT